MRDYQSGRWGFSLVCGLNASVFPNALVLALPNALLAFCLGWYMENGDWEVSDTGKDDAKNAFTVWGGFTSVLFFILYFRSNVAYDRWWEGGTLLQQTRGEWFNAYSSLIAFSSMDPKMQKEVEKYHHLLARLMSLLFSCALQQVSPDKDRPLEIIDPTGIDPQSLMFLKESSDKVEVILQWIQRSTIVNMESKVLPIPPPVMSRAFQEVSRGIVNLQNARKIADFPFPFPFAQTSIVMLLIHWAACPIVTCYLTDKYLASITCFSVIFFLWCINYIALQLEQPFGSDANDLPLTAMQSDWNKSVGTLLSRRAQHPPWFEFDIQHRKLEIIMSDGTSGHKRRLTLPASLGEDGRSSMKSNSHSQSISMALGSAAPSVARTESMQTQGRHRSLGNDIEEFDGADGAVAPDHEAAIPDGGGVAMNNTGTKPNGFLSSIGSIFNFMSTRRQETKSTNQFGLDDGLQFEGTEETFSKEASSELSSSAEMIRKAELAEALESGRAQNQAHASGEAPDGALAASPRRVPMHHPVGVEEVQVWPQETDGIPQALPVDNLSRLGVTDRTPPGSPAAGSRQVGLNAGLTYANVRADVPDHAPGRPPPELGPPDHAPGRPQSDTSRQSQGNDVDNRSAKRWSPEEIRAESLQDGGATAQPNAAPDVNTVRPELGGSPGTSSNAPFVAV